MRKLHARKKSSSKDQVVLDYNDIKKKRDLLRSKYVFEHSGFFTKTKNIVQDRPFSTAIDFLLEPKCYYHSTCGMNPIKLSGILQEGILSKYEAEKRGLNIDANGIQCNGTHYVSTATIFGGCVNLGGGSFHFVIEREKLETTIRKNPQQDMPVERQIYLNVPRNAIKAIQMEKEGFIDIEDHSIKLGIGCDNARALKQVQTYIDFMNSKFKHEMPSADISSLQKIIQSMKQVEDSQKDYFLKKGILARLESDIDKIVKKNLKICFQTVIPKNSITAYDIVRYYERNIPVYDHAGKVVLDSKVDENHKLPNGYGNKLRSGQLVPWSLQPQDSIADNCDTVWANAVFRP